MVWTAFFFGILVWYYFSQCIILALWITSSILLWVNYRLFFQTLCHSKLFFLVSLILHISTFSNTKIIKTTKILPNTSTVRLSSNWQMCWEKWGGFPYFSFFSDSIVCKLCVCVEGGRWGLKYKSLPMNFLQIPLSLYKSIYAQQFSFKIYIDSYLKSILKHFSFLKWFVSFTTEHFRLKMSYNPSMIQSV